MKRIFSLKKVFLILALILGAVIVTSCDTTKTEKTLDSITVSTKNAKTTYSVGDQFSKDGLVVTATYSDKTTKNVTNFDVDSSKFQATVGTYDITVSYTEKNITKTATYKVEVVEVVADHLEVNTDNATTVFVKGDEFSSEGITISIVFSNGEAGSYAENDFRVDSSAYQKDVIGEYTIKVTLTYDGKELTGTYTVKVESNEVLITTVEQFLEMRTFQNANNENPKIYRLGNDLDLTGVTLEPAQGTFTGSFDGQGYTIKNATYIQSASKEGMLFKKVEGATIKNVKFFACTVIGGASETVSMIAGECNAVGVTFENIEFSCCSVDNQTQNYAGLLIGRNESKGVEIIFNQITVKNMTSVKSKQYVGALIGDVIKGTTVIARNCDIDVTLSASNNISVFSGRNRGASVVVENSIVRATIAANTTSSTNQCGVFADGNASSTIRATNVAILKFEMKGEYSTNADLIYGRNTNTNATLTNVYYANDNGSLPTADTTATSVTEETFTSDYLLNTVKLGDKFEKDENKLVKLVNASANTPSKDATVTSLVLVTSSCDKLYFVGEEFSSEGLIVTAIYSDGCVIAITDYTLAILNSKGAEVTAEQFKEAAVGVYTIKVTSNNVSETYTIDLVVVDDITIDDSLVQKVFLKGDTFNATDLIVFRELTNGSHELLATKDYEVTVETFTNAGEYAVTVKYMGFEKTYIISVVEDENEYLTEIEVLVKDTVKTPTVEQGKHVFGTINQALDYLTALNLDAQVIKTICLEGTFEEKVTIDLPNVVLIGTTSNKAVITNNTASGNVIPDETGTYGTDNSATVIITSSAVCFTAKNIMFINSFDYNNSTLANRQALAVRCDADMSVFYQCGFTGYQDTLEAKMGRQYYYQCEISGAVDFIFGNNATAVFEDCEIKALTRLDSKGEPTTNNGYVCATKGYSTASGTDTVTYNYVFMNCNFTADEDVLPGSMAIARPWGTDSSVVTMNCTFTAAYSTLAYDGKAKSRYADMSGNSPLNAKFYEYNNTGVGSITEAVDGMRFLTDDEAATYTLENIFAKVNGQKDYGTTWNVAKDPASANETILIYYYTLGSAEYDNKAEYQESTIKAFTLTGNKLTGFATTNKELTEVITDKDGNTVDPSELTKTAGTYTIKLMNGEEVLAENEITVKDANTKNIMKDHTISGNDLTAGDYTTELKWGNYVTLYHEGKKWSVQENAKSVTDYTGTTLAVANRVKSNGSNTMTIDFTGLDEYVKVQFYVWTGSGSDLTRTITLSATDETFDPFTLTENAMMKYEVTLKANKVYTLTTSNGINFYAINFFGIDKSVEKKAITSNTISADLLEAQEGLFNVKWGDLVTLSGSSDSKTWKVNASSKTIKDFEGNDLKVANRIQSVGSERYLLIDLSQYSGKVKLQIYASGSGATERVLSIVDNAGTNLLTYTSTSSSVVCHEVTVDCGQIYKVTTSNGFNFHGINFIAVEE